MDLLERLAATEGLEVTSQRKRTKDPLPPSQPHPRDPMATSTRLRITPRSVQDKWTWLLLEQGYIPVARVFLRNYSRLDPPLTPREAMFVIHLMDFKWAREAPWPRYRVLAQYMGVTPKQVRRNARSLQEKGYLVRELRKAQSNRFHLDPLFTALEKLKAAGDARG